MHLLDGASLALHPSVPNAHADRREVREEAVDAARQIPLEEIFIVPVRLNPCHVPRSIQRELQYVDLFHDWIDGVTRLVAMLRCEVARRTAVR